MKKHTALFALSIFVIYLFLTASCKEDPTLADISPNETALVETVNELENNKFQEFLNTQLIPETLPPNQYNLLSEESEASNDSTICHERIINETSPEHAEILLPNPVSSFTPGWLYDLNSIAFGGDKPYTEGIGGNRTLSVHAGAWADSVTTGWQSHEIATGISALVRDMPDHAQNVNIIIEEVFSARQAAMKFKAAYNGTFFDFASSMDYSNQDFKYKYMVALNVHDFDIAVTAPLEARDWFPNLDSTRYDLLGGYAPVYVDKISYGKYLMMLIETNQSKLDVYSTISASFGGVFNGGEFDASGQYAALSNSSRIKIQAIGGDAEAATALLSGKPGAVSNYLEKIAADKTGQKAAPLFCQFRFLKDHSKAKIVLATDDYIIRDCRVIPSETRVYDSDDYFNYTVDLVAGDGDFDGDGEGFPYVVGKIHLELRNNDTEVWLVNDTWFYEKRADYTTGRTNDAGQLLLSAPAGKKIIRIVTPNFYNVEYQDFDQHQFEVLPAGGKYGSESLIAQLFINGDTSGEDIPSTDVHTDKSWMKFSLNKVIVEVR